MKKSMLFGLLFCAQFGFNLHAQDTTKPAKISAPYHKAEMGFRLMPAFSNFDVKTSSGGAINAGFTMGYGIGGMLAYNFTDHLGMQGELIYNSLLQKYKDQDIDREIRINYLNVPLLFSLNSGKSKMVNINAVFGPQVGFNAGSSIQSAGGNHSDSFVAVLVTRRSDFGIAYGAGLEFMLNPEKTLRLDMGMRRAQGLINVSKTPNPEIPNDAVVVERVHVKTLSGYMGLTLTF